MTTTMTPMVAAVSGPVLPAPRALSLLVLLLPPAVADYGSGWCHAALLPLLLLLGAAALSWL